METSNQIEDILLILEKSPGILKSFLLEIPEGRLKDRRIKNKWTIHEHACHLLVAEIMLGERLRRFISEENPEFKPYFPAKEQSADALEEYDLNQSISEWEERRKELIKMASKQKEEKFWNKNAMHPEYEKYTPFIMLRHMIMHDFLHMYRIEELFLTKEEFL
jgi:hypothetical protein